MNAERADNSGGSATAHAATGRPDDVGRLLRSAWRDTGTAWRTGATTLVVVVVAATVHTRIPLASGIGVAALVPAAVIDRRHGRLPDPLVAGAAALVLLVATLEARAGVVIEVRSALAGAVVVGGPLLVLHLLSPEAMGFGDVKAAGVLGAAVGLTHWQVALLALALATSATAAVGLARRASTVAFGPGLVAGAATALLLAPVLVPGEEAATPAAADAPRSASAAAIDGSGDPVTRPTDPGRWSRSARLTIVEAA